jgi:hypothetical protein
MNVTNQKERVGYDKRDISLKNTVFWDIMPYSPLKSSRRFEEEFLLTFSGLYGIIRSRDSAVGTETGSGVHPTSYPMGTRVSPWTNEAGA